MRPNHSAPDEPIDWLAEFDSETAAGDADDPGSRTDAPNSGLSMFPSDLLQRPQQREQRPLLHVVPPSPPTGPQPRYGQYFGRRPSVTDRLAGDFDRAAQRLPAYSASALALWRRRRKVFAATAGILVISTAATAGSLVMRRWQRPPENVSDRRLDASASPASAPLFGASIAPPSANPPAPVDVVAPTPTPTPASVPPATTPVPSPPVTTPTPTPQARRISDALTSAARTAAPAPSPLSASLRPSAMPEATSTATTIATEPPKPTPVTTLPAPPTPTPTPTPTPAPARTPATTAAPPPVSPEVAQKTAVQGILDRYRRTFDSLSVDDVATIWPSVNIRTLSRAFDQLESQTVTFDGCTIDIRGPQADATCRGRVKYVPKVGSRSARVDNHQWTFLLQQMGAGWAIMRVDVK
jgi:hypothetical protein